MTPLALSAVAIVGIWLGALITAFGGFGFCVWWYGVRPARRRANAIAGAERLSGGQR